MTDSYKTSKDAEQLRATAQGFYGGRRIKPGEAFFAQSKGESFSWAMPVGAKASRSADRVDESDKHALLNKAIREILPALKPMSDADLRALRDSESKGDNRTTLLNAIDDELANRVGKVDDTDPLS